MNRVALPYVTTTAGISVFDTDNQYRPLLWMDAPEAIDWLNLEDNGLLLTLIERFAPNTGKPMNQPIIRWTEDARLGIHTTIDGAISATATSVTLDDPRVACIDSFLFSPADGEVMRVTAMNYTTGVATVTRGFANTPRVAKADEDILISMSNYMAELSDPIEGHGRLPTTAMWNCISIVSETFKVSRLQENSEVRDGWGQAAKATIDTMLNVRRMVGKALMFNKRYTGTTTNDGQLYISNGMYHYIQDGILDLGDQNSNLTWPHLNEWFDARFDPDASSDTKELICGSYLFKAILRMVRDQDCLERDPYFEPKLGTRVYTITTDQGYAVNCMLDKYGLAVNEGLGSWGFLLDMAHIEGAHYNNLDFQWVQNIQDNRSVMHREDCFIGSFSLIAKHQDCHGVIRGASNPIIVR